MTVHRPEHERLRIINSEDVFRIMREILMREDKIDQDKEHFWVIGLTNANNLLFVELISMGSVKKVIVEPMEVFSVALQKRAVKIMLVHNHPSGQMRASESDKDTTDRLIQVGLIVDTPVLDHLIITPDTYMSFEDTGLMEILRASKKWVPRYKEVERIRSEAIKIGKELGKQEGLIEGEALGVKKGEKAKAIAIAKLMLAEKNFTIKQIAVLTGLSQREVKGLG